MEVRIYVIQSGAPETGNNPIARSDRDFGMAYARATAPVDVESTKGTQIDAHRYTRIADSVIRWLSVSKEYITSTAPVKQYQSTLYTFEVELASA